MMLRFLTLICFAALSLRMGAKPSEGITFLKARKADSALAQILKLPQLKGKLIYGDFWGTTCKPCLEQFRDHVPAMKSRYAGRQDIAFLYICEGEDAKDEALWKKRVRQFNVKGVHVFCTQEQFITWYLTVEGKDTQLIYMPRYFIVDKQGNLLIRSAVKPFRRDKLYAQLDSALAL